MAATQRRFEDFDRGDLRDLSADERAVLDYMLERKQVTSRQLERRLRVRLGMSQVRSACLSLQDRGVLVSLGQTSGSTYNRSSSWLEVWRGVREQLEQAERLRLKEGPRTRPSALSAR